MEPGVPDQNHAGPPAPWPLAQRLAWAARFRRLVASHQPDLCRLICDEIGKTPFEALTGDVMPLLAACRWTERRAPAVLRARRLGAGAFWQIGQRHHVTRQPLGHVAIIATWNYPVQILGIQLLQALVAGNAVTVKPSERCPRTHEFLLNLARRAGAAEPVLTWCDSSRHAGARMLASGHFDHVVFTGSTEVGRAVAESLAPRLISSTLELSGRDSAIVRDDADPDLAAGAIWTAVAFNAGQTCTAPRRALVHDRVYNAFVRALSPRAAGARPVMLIDQAAANHAFELARDAVRRGARSASAVIEPPDARALRPLAIIDCPATAPLVEGRHFGPVIAVVRVHSEAEALAIHHASNQHLATSIFTKDHSRARALAPSLGAGIITINDAVFPTAHPALSIQGIGQSGWGSTRGRAGLLAMTRPVFISSTRSILRPNAEPLPGAWIEKLAALVRWAYGGRSIPAADPSPLAPAPPSAAAPEAHHPALRA